MQYLVTDKHQGSGLAKLKLEHLRDLRDGLKDALERGRIEAAYSTAGGGSAFIVNAENHGDLMRALHRVNAHGVEVTPVVSTLDLIDEHIQHRQRTGGG